MDDGIGLAEALLGLDGFRVLDVVEGPDEVVVTVESMARVVGCSRCGVRAEAQDRMPIDIRDLTCFGRPARLVWIKRRWRCVDADCEAKTWTEHSDHVDAQAVLDSRDTYRREGPAVQRRTAAGEGRRSRRSDTRHRPAVVGWRCVNGPRAPVHSRLRRRVA